MKMNYDDMVRACAALIFNQLKDGAVEKGPVSALTEGVKEALTLYDMWAREQEKMDKAA